ncbi:TATA-box-binding protein [Haladaptatus halobius]|uniref:TATA-box-binding protein n=1 Tax=Haladaptatus halobius TaxID=2884875 RepID=UPI001D0BBAD1|nr:TATA-box-binding protein [Haladaptatus halobius]
MTEDGLVSLQIENVVASSALNQELDLEQLADDLSNATYNPDNSPAVIYRAPESTSTILLFRSGKLVSTGADSLAAANHDFAHLFTLLTDLGIQVPDDPFITTQNIVSVADLGYSLNLNALAIGLGLEQVEYEPEQFPGLIYRLDDPSVVILLFGSGKLVITGAATRQEAEAGVDQVRTRLADLGMSN